MAKNEKGKEGMKGKGHPTFNVETNWRRCHDDYQWLAAQERKRQSADGLPDDGFANICKVNVKVRRWLKQCEENWGKGQVST